MKKIILCAAIATLLAACSSAPTSSGDKTAPTAGTNSAATTQASKGNTTTTPPAATNSQKNALNDQKDTLAQRSVYFDFDKYLVDEKYRALIQAHAAHLKKNPNQKITLEGNTDDRGSSEYNLALGQKRAEAVRKMMTLLGVADKQLEAVSFGKEKPKAANKDESSRAQNRRADLHYKGE